jgi:NAD(P)-dependent dehydrogenase (short-subunit alcohol dehydrogenase family)
MDLDLGDKVAVVTGAGRASGWRSPSCSRTVTKLLAEEGARVVAGSRTTDTLEGLDNVIAVAVDLSAGTPQPRGLRSVGGGRPIIRP